MTSIYERRSERNIDRAIEAGEEALQKLIPIRKRFASASNWGIFTVVRGKRLTNVLKNMKASRTDQLVKDGSIALQRFREALNGVQSLSAMDHDLSKMVCSDYFQGGPLIDTVVQVRIRNNLRKLDRAINEVTFHLERLKRHRERKNYVG